MRYNSIPCSKISNRTERKKLKKKGIKNGECSETTLQLNSQNMVERELLKSKREGDEQGR